MRKLLLILALALVASGAFAQARTVIDYNGYDWATWSYDQKIAIVTGYILGIDTYRKAMTAAWSRTKDETIKKTLSNMYDWGDIGANVGQIAQRIEGVYNIRDDKGRFSNRTYPIFELIVHDFQVPWWVDKDGHLLNMDGSPVDDSTALQPSS